MTPIGAMAAANACLNRVRLRRDFSLLARQEEFVFGLGAAFVFDLAAMMSPRSVANLMVLIREDAPSRNSWKVRSPAGRQQRIGAHPANPFP